MPTTVGSRQDMARAVRAEAGTALGGPDWGPLVWKVGTVSDARALISTRHAARGVVSAPLGASTARANGEP